MSHCCWHGGGGFCAGGDVESMGERSAASFELHAAGIQFSNQIPRLMRTIPKTIIAMVNGVAVGAGLSMALACDLRIAARSANLAQDFSNSVCPAIGAAPGH